MDTTRRLVNAYCHQCKQLTLINPVTWLCVPCQAVCQLAKTLADEAKRKEAQSDA